jgi:hypothetical protein
MQLIKQNEATAVRRTIFLLAANSADDTPYTSGLSGADLKISKGGAAEGNSAGTATHLGGGLYKYEFTTGEVDTLGALSVRISKTGVWGDVYTAQIVTFDPYGTWSTNVDVAVSSRVAQASYAAPSTLLTEPDGVETGWTLQEAIRIILSAAAAKLSGAGTGTEVFRNVTDTKNRITSTVDTSGNRTAVTYDKT